MKHIGYTFYKGRKFYTFRLFGMLRPFSFGFSYPFIIRLPF